MEGRGIPLKLLLVEDSEDDALLLVRGLRRNGFDVTYERVDKESDMVRALDTQDWDIVISDYNMPQFDALRALELSKNYDPDIPFIVVSGAIGEESAVALMRSGVCDYVLKHNLNRLYPAITRELDTAKMKREGRIADRNLKTAFFDLVETVSRAVGSRDPYTADHQRRVAILAREVGKQMGLPENVIEGLYIGGLLHDIGKISIPESLLSRPGELVKEEWDLMRTHPQRGYDILKDTQLPWPTAEMALHHHERLDGSGYPDGIKGDELTQEVRVLGVCDVVEAMLSHRPYRPARTDEETLEEIEGGRGTKYDPEVVDVIVPMITSGRIFEIWPDHFRWKSSS